MWRFKLLSHSAITCGKNRPAVDRLRMRKGMNIGWFELKSVTHGIQLGSESLKMRSRFYDVRTRRRLSSLLTYYFFLLVIVT